MATPTSYSRVPRLRFRRSVLVDSSIATGSGVHDRAACCCARAASRRAASACGFGLPRPGGFEGRSQRGRVLNGGRCRSLRVRLDQSRRSVLRRVPGSGWRGRCVASARRHEIFFGASDAPVLKTTHGRSARGDAEQLRSDRAWSGAADTMSTARTQARTGFRREETRLADQARGSH
jgi:hypothetical protein